MAINTQMIQNLLRRPVVIISVILIISAYMNLSTYSQLDKQDQEKFVNVVSYLSNMIIFFVSFALIISNCFNEREFTIVDLISKMFGKSADEGPLFSKGGRRCAYY